MLVKLSGKKEVIYNFYEELLKKGKQISYADAGEKLGMNASSVFQHVNELVKLGYLEKKSDGSLALIDTSSTENIPLLGYISCGSPLEIIEEYETIDVPKSLLKENNNFYALIARGKSMQEKKAGIFPNDYVIIQQQSDVNDGEIAVLIETDGFDEFATLKQIFHTMEGILAKPKNPSFDSFIVKNKNALIRGKLVGVIRNYNS